MVARIGACLALFISSCFLLTSGSVANGLDVGDYSIVYERVPVFDKAGVYLNYDVGKVVISNKFENEKRFVEYTTLAPGCDGFPDQSKIKVSGIDVAVLCGSIGGRHQTLKAYWVSSNGLSSSSIDFFDGVPNIEFHGDVAVSIVFRKRIVRGVYSGMSFPHAYIFGIDQSVGGFGPASEDVRREIYMDNFNKIFNSGNISSGEHLDLALIFLLETRDSAVICPSIRGLKAKYANGDMINSVIHRVISSGYPDFNFELCLKEGKYD